MTTQVKRGKLGYEDVEFGLGTFQRYGPTGALEVKTQIRASHIPILDALALYEAAEIEAALAEVRGVIDSVIYPEIVQRSEAVCTAGWEGELHLGQGILHGNLAEMTRRLVLPGVITMYGAAAAPLGWLLCNGATVSRVTYAGLFAIIGTTYGVGDGLTTFDLPDIRGRFPIGAGAGAGLTNRVLAATGGAETVNLEHAHTMTGHVHSTGDFTLLIADMPAHDHGGVVGSAGAHTHNLYVGISGGGGTAIISGSCDSQTWNTTYGAASAGAHAGHSITSEGGSTAHNHGNTGSQTDTMDNQGSTTQTVMNPFLALTFIIKT